MRFQIVIVALLIAVASAAPQYFGGFGGYYIPHAYGASPGYYGTGVGYGTFPGAAVGFQRGAAGAGGARGGAGAGGAGSSRGYTNSYAG